MNAKLTSALVLGFLLFASIAPALAQTPVTPLPQAHAHNDYEHARPLFDALDHGFCSVEADVWLVDGQLLVAHDLKDAKPARTLQRLYLDPLKERVQVNGGRVYPNGPIVTLLIDAKSEATNTYIAIRDALRPYRSMLTVFHSNRTETNAITVVISGNRAGPMMAAERERLSGYDGRLADLDGTPAPSSQFMPLVSDNWRLHFQWKGGPNDGALPTDEKVRLRAMVERAHARGMRLRFWGMPDSPVVWQTLRDAGVDYINTDDLHGLARFLKP